MERFTETQTTRGMVALNLILPALVVLHSPWCLAQESGSRIIHDPCDVEIGQWDAPRPDASASLESYFWCLEYTKSSDQAKRLETYLRKRQDGTSDVSEIATLLQSRGLRPLPSTDMKEDLQFDEGRFDKASNSWKFNISREESGPVSYIDVKGSKDLIAFGSFVAKSLLSAQAIEVNHGEVVMLKPSTEIKGRVFCSACSPLRCILATDKGIFYTFDGFRSYDKLAFSPIAEEIQAPVSGITLTGKDVYFLMAGRLYVGTLGGHRLINITSNEQGAILGISPPSICYRGNHPLVENSHLYAWSNTALYKVFTNNTGEVTTKELNITSKGDNLLLSVHTTVNPHYIILHTKSAAQQKLLKCRVYPKNIANCTDIYIQESVSMTHVETLASPGSSFLTWGSNEISQVIDSRHWVKKFSSNIKDVYMNAERSEWLVHTEEEKVYFGRLHSPTMSKITMPQSSSGNFALLFLTGKDLRHIERLSDTDTIQIEDLRLAEILASSPDENLNKVLFQSPSTKNVMRIESLRDSFSVRFEVLTSPNNVCEFGVNNDFQDLQLYYTTKEEISTRTISPRITTRVKTFDVNVIANCTTNPLACATGYGLLEVTCQPTSQTTSSVTQLHALSKVFLINMTCPAGLRLRLAEEGYKGGCGNKTLGPCTLQLRMGYLLHLKFEIVRYEEYLSDATDDILLTELNNRTGFLIYDLNLLKKDCYHCAHFKEMESPSELMLQTMKTGCPCLANDKKSHKWVGNISFDDASSASNSRYHFSAKALSRSLCDLKTEFIVEVVSDPSLTFLSLELIFLSVWVIVTALSLCFSYHNYIKHMKNHREEEKRIEKSKTSSL